jgi:hypothetical protein
VGVCPANFHLILTTGDIGQMSDSTKYPPGTPIDAIFDGIMRGVYLEATLNRLEYIGYPEMIIEFPPEVISPIMNAVVRVCYEFNLSPRMCALILFGTTYEKISQVHANSVKH